MKKTSGEKDTQAAVGVTGKRLKNLMVREHLGYPPVDWRII